MAPFPDNQVSSGVLFHVLDDLMGWVAFEQDFLCDINRSVKGFLRGIKYLAALFLLFLFKVAGPDPAYDQPFGPGSRKNGQ